MLFPFGSRSLSVAAGSISTSVVWVQPGVMPYYDPAGCTPGWCASYLARQFLQTELMPLERIKSTAHGHAGRVFSLSRVGMRRVDGVVSRRNAFPREFVLELSDRYDSRAPRPIPVRP